jgi:hypothetical protein
MVEGNNSKQRKGKKIKTTTNIVYKPASSSVLVDTSEFFVKFNISGF